MTGLITAAGPPNGSRVTVVIPCYNQGHFLAEAIESAIGQTYPLIEIIVVDDGSTDATRSVASAYRNVLYVRQENLGLGAARNRGLRESTGEFVVFLDSDDRLHPHALEAGRQHLGLDRSIAFAYGRCDFIGADGTRLAMSDRPLIDGDHYQALLHGNFLPNPAAIMFRRSAVDAVGGFSVSPKGKGTEDYDLCLRLARHHAACGYKEVIADYRQHDASMSRDPRLMSESVLHVLQSQEQYVWQNRKYVPAWRQGMRNWRRRYHSEVLVARIRTNAREGHWSLVVRDAASLLRANPVLLIENAQRRIRAGLLRSKPSGGI
jgi:glycosyltransferase involved in cell wall biosynthesis